MEPEVDRDPRVGAGVGERPVHALAVGDRHVAGGADERHGVGEPVGAGGLDHRLDVDLAHEVRAGHDPQPVGRRAAVELAHEVEAVGAAVELRAVPVRPAVLVPRHRPAEAGLLDPHRLVERHEVVAVDRRRHARAGRDGRTPAGRRGRTAAIRGRSAGRGRARPPAASGSIILAGCRPLTARGAADRVGQRLDPAQVAVAPVGAERRTTVAVEGGALGDRRVVEHRDDVALDVLQLLGAQHALEDVEAGAVVGLDDRRVDGAVAVKRIGPRLPSAAARASPSRR